MRHNRMQHCNSACNTHAHRTRQLYTANDQIIIITYLHFLVLRLRRRSLHHSPLTLIHTHSLVDLFLLRISCVLFVVVLSFVSAHFGFFVFVSFISFFFVRPFVSRPGTVPQSKPSSASCAHFFLTGSNTQRSHVPLPNYYLLNFASKSAQVFRTHHQ